MGFTVEDLRDLVELLRAHPEWREVLWALLASEDVLRLPGELAAFRAEVERRFAELAEAIRRLSEAFVAHRQEFLAYQAQNEARFAELSAAVRALMETQRQLVDTQRQLMEAQRQLMEAQGRAEENLQRLSEAFVAHRQEFLAYQAQNEARFAELAEAVRRLSEAFVAHRQEFLEHRQEFLDLRREFQEHRQEFLEYRAETERRFAELAEAQRRHYEEFAAHRQEFLEYRAETDRRFAELAEAQRRTEESLAAHRAETERRFAELAEAQRRTEESLAAHRVETDRRFAELAETVRTLARRVGDLDGLVRGWIHEDRYRTRSRRYRRLVRDPHILSPEEREAFLRQMEMAGRLTPEEAAELEEADVLVRGRSRATGGEVFLVVEVSATVDTDDVERAVERAEMLRRAEPGVEVIPVVAGPAIHPRAAQAARDQGVWWLTDSRPYAPNELPPA